MIQNHEDSQQSIQKILNKIPIEKVGEYCKKYNLKLPSEYQMKHQFMINKNKFSKNDECIICMDEKKIIPYDCFGHYFCEECYHQLDKCPVCRVDKHPIMNSNHGSDQSELYDDDDSRSYITYDEELEQLA
jgi:hypothetical protein